MGAFLSSLEPYDTLPKRLKYFTQIIPNKELFVFYEEDKRKTFTTLQVYDLASKFASILRQRGFQKNDVILNSLQNSPERLITDLGIVFAGCIPTNAELFMSDGSDLYHFCQDAGAKGIIVCPRETDPRWNFLKTFVVGEVKDDLFIPMNWDKTPDMKKVMLVERPGGEGKGCQLLSELETSHEPGFVADLDPDDMLCLATSSGSTGWYKLIPRTHRCIFEHMTALSGISQALDELPDKGSLFNDRPLGWLGGHPFGTWGVGHTRVLLDIFNDITPKFRSDHIWNIIQKEKCTVAVFLPTDYQHVVSHVKTVTSGNKGHKLSVLVTGGQPLFKNQFQDFPYVTEKIFPAYGLTEVAYAVLEGVGDPSDLEDYRAGRPVQGLQIRVVNKDNVECKPREIGEIQIKGDLVMSGYFNRSDPENSATKAAFTSDGWYRPHDRGYVTEDGILYILGRTTEVITHGFSTVYPSVVESIIRKHPEVEQALVVPVTDPQFFQNVCACVQLKAGSQLTEEALHQFCLDAFIEDYKDDEQIVPQFYMILPTFPRTFSGKVDKKLLKAQAEALFGWKGDKK